MSPIAMLSTALRYDPAEAILARGPGTLAAAYAWAATAPVRGPEAAHDAGPDSDRTTVAIARVGSTLVSAT